MKLIMVHQIQAKQGYITNHHFGTKTWLFLTTRDFLLGVDADNLKERYRVKLNGR